MRGVYVYRLAVTLPAGSDAPGWEPDSWVGWCEDHGWWEYEEDTGARNAPTFSWPRLMQRKHFLSAEGAERRARMLRGFGALVEVERSEAVSWTTP